jgi:hypothetical protein
VPIADQQLAIESLHLHALLGQCSANEPALSSLGEHSLRVQTPPIAAGRIFPLLHTFLVALSAGLIAFRRAVHLQRFMRSPLVVVASEFLAASACASLTERQ